MLTIRKAQDNVEPNYSDSNEIPGLCVKLCFYVSTLAKIFS